MLETIVTALLPIVVTLLLGYFAGLRHDFSPVSYTHLDVYKRQTIPAN